MPPTSSSVASKESILKSTDSTRPLKRKGGLGAWCTGRVANHALKRCALSTVIKHIIGRSSTGHIPIVCAMLMFEVAAHWKTVACANGEFTMVKTL